MIRREALKLAPVGLLGAIGVTEAEEDQLVLDNTVATPIGWELPVRESTREVAIHLCTECYRQTGRKPTLVSFGSQWILGKERIDGALAETKYFLFPSHDLPQSPFLA